MFQNQKLKRNATSAIAEVAEVALCPPLRLILITNTFWINLLLDQFL